MLIHHTARVSNTRTHRGQYRHRREARRTCLRAFTEGACNKRCSINPLWVTLPTDVAIFNFGLTTDNSVSVKGSSMRLPQRFESHDLQVQVCITSYEIVVVVWIDMAHTSSFTKRSAHDNGILVDNLPSRRTVRTFVPMLFAFFHRRSMLGLPSLSLCHAIEDVGYMYSTRVWSSDW